MESMDLGARSSKGTISRTDPSSVSVPATEDAGTGAGSSGELTSGLPSFFKSKARPRAGRRPLGPYLATIAVVAVAALAVLTGTGSFPTALRLPVGEAIESWFTVFVDEAAWLHKPVAGALEDTFDSLVVLLKSISPAVLVAGVVLLLAYLRGPRVALLATVTFAWVILAGLWATTIQTLAFMVVAVVISSVIGIGLGLVASTSSRVNGAVQLVLDAMQAFPAFAYLVPIVFLFGTGNTGALVVTIIWAAPPIARMTSLGLRNVSSDTIEAGLAAGANPWQLLWGVKFPLAAQSIRAGLNQTIMYTVAMATLAAMIGAEGLGAPVWSGLTRLEFGDALEGGVAIVLLAMLLDRATAPHENAVIARTGKEGRAPGFLKRPSRTALLLGGTFLAVLVVSQVSRGSWQNFAKPPWGTPLDLRKPVDDAVQWMTINWGPTFDAAGTVVQSYGLNLLGEFFTSIPWTLVVVGVVVAGMAVVGKVKGAALGLCVLAIGVMGMWTPTVQVLAVVTTAIIIVLLIGLPLGVLMSSSTTAEAVMRPVLDVLQTAPVYLFVIPAVLVFGTGEVAAVLGTVLGAAPPMVRYTNAALRGVDPEVVEAAVSMGATPGQVLRQIRIPMGLQTIMVGLNQSVLLALVMAVVGAMIGAPGLGQDLLASIQTVDLARGVAAGLAMLFLALVLDRLLNGSARALAAISHTSASNGKAES